MNLQPRDRSDDGTVVTLSEDIKLSRREIRKLCLKGRKIEENIIHAYLKVLTTSNN